MHDHTTDATHVQVILENLDEGYVFSEWIEELESDDWTTGDLYRMAQREYGRCTSRLYHDTDDGPAPAGWYFVKRDDYQDGGSYLRGAWVTPLRLASPAVAARYEMVTS